MSLFKVNFEKLTALVIPTALRKPLFFAVCKALASPFKTLHEVFISRRDAVLTLLKYDSSKYNIERYLNITFGDGGEDIYITMAASTDTAYLTEFLPFGIYDPDNYGIVSPTYLSQYLGFYIDAVERGIDFTVHVPTSMHDRADDIKAAVLNLALPSYSFNIVEY